MSKYDGPWEAHSPSERARKQYAERLAAPDSEQMAIRAKQDEDDRRVHASGYEPGSFSPDAPDPAADAQYGRSANSIGPAAATTGGTNYRCTRGGAGCGAPLGGPEDQDEHNQTTHGKSGWGRQGE